MIQKYGGNYILAFAAMAFVAFVSAMEGWGCWSENRKLEKHFRENGRSWTVSTRARARVNVNLELSRSGKPCQERISATGWAW